MLTALTGALITLAADPIGRVAFVPVQLPAGIVTVIIGVPVFVLPLLRSAAREPLVR